MVFYVVALDFLLMTTANFLQYMEAQVPYPIYIYGNTFCVNAMRWKWFSSSSFLIFFYFSIVYWMGREREVNCKQCYTKNEHIIRTNDGQKKVI